MATPPDTHRQHRSNAFARQRDARILWLLESHPATAGMLVAIGLFGSKARARRRLRRLVEQRRLRHVGTVRLEGGQWQHVYCRCRWVRPDALLHEVQLSRLCFRMHADEVRRGPDEVDRDLRPDAELLIGNHRYLLEFDHGTVSYQEIVQERFAKYLACPDVVLWVCHTPARMEGLRRRADMIRQTALFTTLDLALVDPHAAIWMDFDGETAALPRGGTGSPLARA